MASRHRHDGDRGSRPGCLLGGLAAEFDGVARVRDTGAIAGSGTIDRISGVSSTEELRAGRPEICVVGARTGRHCGVLDDVSGTRVTWAGIPAVEGDSGGPVYARWPDGSFTAVGVINTVHTRTDGTGTGGGTGTLIAADIEANEMTLLGVS